MVITRYIYIYRWTPRVVYGAVTLRVCTRACVCVCVRALDETNVNVNVQTAHWSGAGDGSRALYRRTSTFVATGRRDVFDWSFPANRTRRDVKPLWTLRAISLVAILRRNYYDEFRGQDR